MKTFLLPLLAAALAACDPAGQPIEQPVIMPDSSPFQYPVALWDRKLTGEVVLLVHVTREGTVDSVSVFNSSGHAQFDSSAVLGARKLRFVPGRRGERHVSMWTRLPVRFAFDTIPG